MDGLVRGIRHGPGDICRGKCRTEKRGKEERKVKILYTLSTCMIIIALLFLGGMYVGTKIIGRLNDDELAELADDFESELGIIRDEYREQARILKRANQYLKDSIVERNRETEHDKERINNLESTVERLQIATGESLDEIGNIARTIQQIEQAANGIGEDIQGLRKEVQRIQRSERNEDWWFSTGKYNPEDWWRHLISRYNRDFLYRDF